MYILIIVGIFVLIPVFLTDKERKLYVSVSNHIAMLAWTVAAFLVSAQGCPLYWHNGGLLVWTFISIAILVQKPR